MERVKPQVWASYLGVGAAVLTGLGLVTFHLAWAGVWAAFAVGCWMAGRAWNRRDPIPMPPFMRWLMFLPRGPHAPRHLVEILGPRAGERMLEIGPGPGVHALAVARALAPGGVLEAVDVQAAMLRHLERRARNAGVANIVTRQGDARHLPYLEHLFDAAYLVTVLGEIPDEVAALRELRRVLKPEGRLVIGEFVVDPDFISLPALEEKARDAGLLLERSRGPRFSYFALFRPTPVAERRRARPLWR